MAMIKLTGINKIYRTNEKETLALKSLRRQYTGFIHRDLTDLSFYISNNLNEIKKQKYEYISSILYKGE